MTEEKVKNRGWVKNAAIIFLAVMLVLTFFSNTIMNRSLPEVAAQYAQSGTITTQIRGTGSIEAAETYEVKAADARKVQSVAVRVGQEVAVGDLLVTLAEGDSADLESAKKTLEDLQYSYQEKLIGMGSDNADTGESSALTRAREKLADAIATRDALTRVTTTEINTAKIAYDDAQAKLAAAGGETTGSDSDYSSVQSAYTALNNAKIALQAAKLANMGDYTAEDAYNALRTVAEYLANPAGSVNSSGTAFVAGSTPSTTVAAYMKALAAEYAPAVSSGGTGSAASSSGSAALSGLIEATDAIHSSTTALNIKLKATDTSFVSYSKTDMADAYDTITSAQSAVDSAQTAYNSAYNSYTNSLSPDNSALIKKRDAAKAEYEALVQAKSDYETASDSVISCQEALEQLVQSEALADLSLQKLIGDINDQYAVINKLATGSAGGDIKSEVAGVVKSINVTAGNTTDPNTPLITIEVPDRGYTVSISVTKDQAKRVTVGSSATVSTGYWGAAEMSAKLVRISTDPKNPQTNKLLIFQVTGEEVESGTQVSISVGEKSQSFDVIVPNSAIREDSNGKFVLIMAVKSSPLGNRYVATRADVQVLASDDTYSAVSGGVSSWGDYVITTSTQPIESGMSVRMAES